MRKFTRQEIYNISDEMYLEYLLEEGKSIHDVTVVKKYLLDIFLLSNSKAKYIAIYRGELPREITITEFDFSFTDYEDIVKIITDKLNKKKESLKRFKKLEKGNKND